MKPQKFHADGENKPRMKCTIQQANTIGPLPKMETHRLVPKALAQRLSRRLMTLNKSMKKQKSGKRSNLLVPELKGRKNDGFSERLQLVAILHFEAVPPCAFLVKWF